MPGRMPMHLSVKPTSDTRTSSAGWLPSVQRCSSRSKHYRSSTATTDPVSGRSCKASCAPSGSMSRRRRAPRSSKRTPSQCPGPLPSTSQNLGRTTACATHNAPNPPTEASGEPQTDPKALQPRVHPSRPLLPAIGARRRRPGRRPPRSEEHTSELQSRPHLVCRLLLEKKKKKLKTNLTPYKENKK